VRGELLGRDENSPRKIAPLEQLEHVQTCAFADELAGGDVPLFDAALDLAWTAAGRFDAYYERSVKQWDIAAGALICERAGLQIRELPEHENLPWGILAAPPALAGPLFELVSGP